MLVSCGSVSNVDSNGSSVSQEESLETTDTESGIGDEELQNDVNIGSTDEKSKNAVSLDGELKVHFIDVGQADSILIQQGNNNMLIDAGNNDDEDTLRNYINNLGIKEFTYVVGTHPHEDHIGSMDYIINSFKVGKIYFPKTTATTKTFENLVKAVQNKGMQFTAPAVGETFNLGEAKCTILAPNSDSYEDANNYSIVIKLEYGNTSFLFTGDAEDVSEKEMLSNGLDLKADVLKAGHHGSKSSSTDAFLNAVNPKYAVISVGKDNDYGHPNKETLQKFSSRGIKVYRTDESGTIVVTSDGNNITFSANPSTSNDSGTTANSSEKKNNYDSNTASNNSSTLTNNSNTDHTQNSSDIVWVSRNNGKVYHKDKTCSGLKNPLEYTQEEAENEGLRPCSKCAK